LWRKLCGFDFRPSCQPFLLLFALPLNKLSLRADAQLSRFENPGVVHDQEVV